MDSKAQALFKPIEVDDMASASDVAKQFNDRLQGIQEWVTGVVESKTKAVKDDFIRESSRKEEVKVAEFAKTHPELKAGSDVATIMEQLYARGNTDLEDIYKKACTASGVKAIQIKDGKNVNLVTGNVIGEDGKEVEAKGTKKDISSLKSDSLDTSGETPEDELIEDKDIEGKTIRQVAESNWNKALADAGMDDIPE